MVLMGKVKTKIKALKNKVYRFATLKVIFPNWYKWHARKLVQEDKVVFIEVRFSELPNSFQIIFDKLLNEYSFDIYQCFLRNGFVKKKEYFFRCLSALKEISTAKYVFLNDTCDVIGAVPFRKESKLVQLWHGCGAFKKFGFSTADLIFGDDRKTQLKYPPHNNYDFVTVSSPEVIWAYAEAMQLENKKEIIKPLGISRTDVFYDEQFIENAKNNILSLIPDAQNKKIILYAPTFRGRVAKAQAPTALNIEMLGEALADEYILLIKHHQFVKKLPSIPKTWCTFAYDVTNLLSIEDLLCAADVCISDYSSLVFEYSLLERPMLFFAFDIEEYLDWRGFYYPYEELVAGPVVQTNKEIIDYIKHPEKFDMQKVKDFKQKFMCSCDGHATERILQEAFGEDLEKYRYSNIEVEKESRCHVCEVKVFSVKQLCKDYLYKKLQQKYDALDKKEQKVVFLLQNDQKLTRENQILFDELQAKDIDVKVCVLEQKNKKTYLKNCYEAVQLLAEAKFIIVQENVILLQKINLHKGTALLHTGGKKKRTAFMDKMLKTINAENLLQEDIGLLYLDCYFSESYIAEQREKLVGLESDKKIVLFVANSNAMNKINWQYLYEFLADEYQVVLLKTKKQLKINIPEYLKSFITVKTGDKVNQLLPAADLVVTDTNLNVLNGLLVEKTILFWGELENSFYVRLENDDLKEYYVKILCSTTKELLQAIEAPYKAEQKQREKIVAYREIQCDGHMCERLVNRISMEVRNEY